MTDTFNGDNARLIDSINALLELDAAGSLVPHGVGGHARQLLSAAAARLAPECEHKEQVILYNCCECKDCGAVRTDSQWGPHTSNRWFSSYAEAKANRS